MSNSHQRRLKRSESFFGIHFDFHAGKDCTTIGENVTPAMVENIIDQVHPDFLQCDCKGHPGISSYPTLVGNPAPGFVRDPLKIWRRVTEERGVGLYMHYSGVWDAAAIEHHPTWARIDEHGKRDKKNTSVFGPYVDRLLIPQLTELALDYHVDGVWVDGECWATCEDYSRKAQSAFQKETGIQEIPRKPEDPHFHDYLEFCREGFRRYLCHYVDEMHRLAPDFQITSNWAFSSFMPEPVIANLDFLSGDYSCQNSVNSARLEGRVLQQQGKPWDLMAWSFAARWSEGCWSTKSIVQLEQELSVVLALGGGVQIYFQQLRDGSVAEWQAPLMAQAARFCRDRQALCHHAVPVPQIGLILSTRGFYSHNQRQFSAWGGTLDPLRGILHGLLDNQQSVEILMDHNLHERIAEYPLLILPEWDDIGPDLIRRLLNYVESGGNLIVVGPRSIEPFQDAMKVQLQESPEDKCHWIEYDGCIGALKTVSQPVELLDGATPFGALCKSNDPQDIVQPAASVASFGKGKIAAVFTNLGERLLNAVNPATMQFLKSIVQELFPNPIVSLIGSHSVDISVNRIDGKLAINLVNTGGPHANPSVYAFDEIPPAGPLEIRIRSASKPTRVTIEPGVQAPEWSYTNGIACVAIPSVKVHSVIVVGGWTGQ